MQGFRGWRPGRLQRPTCSDAEVQGFPVVAGFGSREALSSPASPALLPSAISINRLSRTNLDRQSAHNLSLHALQDALQAHPGAKTLSTAELDEALHPEHWTKFYITPYTEVSAPQPPCHTGLTLTMATPRAGSGRGLPVAEIWPCGPDALIPAAPAAAANPRLPMQDPPPPEMHPCLLFALGLRSDHPPHVSIQAPKKKILPVSTAMLELHMEQACKAKMPTYKRFAGATYLTVCVSARVRVCAYVYVWSVFACVCAAECDRVHKSPWCFLESHWSLTLDQWLSRKHHGDLWTLSHWHRVSQTFPPRCGTVPCGRGA